VQVLYSEALSKEVRFYLVRSQKQSAKEKTGPKLGKKLKKIRKCEERKGKTDGTLNLNRENRIGTKRGRRAWAGGAAQT